MIVRGCQATLLDGGVAFGGGGGGVRGEVYGPLAAGQHDAGGGRPMRGLGCDGWGWSGGAGVGRTAVAVTAFLPRRTSEEDVQLGADLELSTSSILVRPAPDLAVVVVLLRDLEERVTRGDGVGRVRNGGGGGRLGGGGSYDRGCVGRDRRNARRNVLGQGVLDRLDGGRTRSEDDGVAAALVVDLPDQVGGALAAGAGAGVGVTV